MFGTSKDSSFAPVRGLALPVPACALSAGSRRRLFAFALTGSAWWPKFMLAWSGDISSIFTRPMAWSGADQLIQQGRDPRFKLPAEAEKLEIPRLT